MFAISQNQAKEIALLIYSDIQSYIDTHRAEYELFLVSEAHKARKETSNDNTKFHKK